MATVNFTISRSRERTSPAPLWVKVSSTTVLKDRGGPPPCQKKEKGGQGHYPEPTCLDPEKEYQLAQKAQVLAHVDHCESRDTCSGCYGKQGIYESQSFSGTARQKPEENGTDDYEEAKGQNRGPHGAQEGHLPPRPLRRGDDSTTLSSHSSQFPARGPFSRPNKKWSGRLDLNQRPPEPHSGALPVCATSRPEIFIDH
jgi:hypothetical protein